MAMTNHDRVGKALELLRKGLIPYVERELKAEHGEEWQEQLSRFARNEKDWLDNKGNIKWDAYRLLQVMWDQWNIVFKNTLGKNERSLVSELQTARNAWAHQEVFSTDDAYRVMDSIARLLSSVSAKETEEVDSMKQDILRVRYSEQSRYEQRKKSLPPVDGQHKSGLKPWREIVTPHPDVSSGRFQQAEFAANLAQVYKNQGHSEYLDPKDFFARTYPTEGIRHLLTKALLRLTGKNGDPVVELQTSFGGGKTHSMIALYHLFSGTPAGDLAGIEDILKETGIKELPKANRAVLVGTALSPAEPTSTGDKIEVRTLWGEMAYQLGGKAGYKMVAESDQKGVNPGSDILSKLFTKYSPCLILIDEWIAYVRQLYKKHDLPGGSFDANMSFAQSLTEAAKAAPNTMVVITTPASDIEIGGEGGMEGLERLKHILERIESTWRPASAEEGFEIVRRRLFQPVVDNQKYVLSDAVIDAYCKMYRDQAAEFPSKVCEGDYKERMKRAYPIHPELFDRLYQDWGSIDKFQMTRGVLRLMAAVIHELWERNDSNLLIMPGNVTIDAYLVNSELTRYLDDNWAPIIEKEVDGSNSLPINIDRENPNLGRYSACRRVARSIYMGSAPLAKSKNPGVTDQKIKLGCVQPGESVAIFGDALRRLTDDANYVHVDGKRYWYSTQATPTKIAKERAGNFEEYEVYEELKKRIRKDKSRGDFVRVHSIPEASGDVPDDMEARLVILGPEYYHMAKNQDSPGMRQAVEILNQRGNNARLYKNTLVFLVPDRTRLQELENAVRWFMAWETIVRDREALNLDAFNLKQSETKLEQSNRAVDDRLRETYIWVLVPNQPDPNGPVEWEETRLQVGTDPYANRISRKLRNDELLITQFSATRLQMELDRYLWKDVEHLSLKKLWEYLCTYLYLPRLRDEKVLSEAVQDGVRSTTWMETFAYAEGWDEEKKRYNGLKAGQLSGITIDSMSVIVKPEAAQRQLDAVEAERMRRAEEQREEDRTSEPGLEEDTITRPDAGITSTESSRPKRFHGSVVLDPVRLGRDASTIANEVIQHLTGLVGAEMEITLEIQARVPDGVPDDVVRTVTENCRTLKFDDQGFEEE